MAMTAIEGRDGRTLEPLDGRRCAHNECTARDMAGCLEDKDGRVVCFFPSLKMYAQWAETFCRLVEKE